MGEKPSEARPIAISFTILFNKLLSFFAAKDESKTVYRITNPDCHDKENMEALKDSFFMSDQTRYWTEKESSAAAAASRHQVGLEALEPAQMTCTPCLNLCTFGRLRNISELPEPRI